MTLNKFIVKHYNWLNKRFYKNKRKMNKLETEFTKELNKLR